MKKNNILKVCSLNPSTTKTGHVLKALCLTAVGLLAGSEVLQAQNLSGGIDGASSEVKNVFANVSNLILVIGAVVGLVGGIRVYVKWQHGDQDVQKHLVGWVGASMFLLLAGTILKTFYGI